MNITEEGEQQNIKIIRMEDAVADLYGEHGKGAVREAVLDMNGWRVETMNKFIDDHFCEAVQEDLRRRGKQYKNNKDALRTLTQKNGRLTDDLKEADKNNRTLVKIVAALGFVTISAFLIYFISAVILLRAGAFQTLGALFV